MVVGESILWDDLAMPVDGILRDNVEGARTHFGRSGSLAIGMGICNPFTMSCCRISVRRFSWASRFQYNRKEKNMNKKIVNVNAFL